jgi:hypothetical protein
MKQQVSPAARRELVKWIAQAALGWVAYGLLLFLAVGRLDWLWGWAQRSTDPPPATARRMVVEGKDGGFTVSLKQLAPGCCCRFYTRCIRSPCRQGKREGMHDEESAYDT